MNDDIKNGIIKHLCKVNYRDSTMLVNNKLLSMKEYKEMLIKIIWGLNGTRF